MLFNRIPTVHRKKRSKMKHHLGSFNKALFGKWLWRFGNERQALWRRVIGAEYGCEGGGWCSLPVIGPHGVSLWKSISRGWPSFVRHIQFKVGAGFIVRFWQDIWCGDTSLCVPYPRFFSLSRNKEAYMVDLMKFPNDVLFWDLTFRRYSEDWELESFYCLMSKIYGASLKGVGDDKMCWKPDMVRGLVVRSYY